MYRQPESATDAQLEVTGLQSIVDTADYQNLFTQIELKSLVRLKPQQHKRVGTFACTAALGTSEVCYYAIANSLDSEYECQQNGKSA